MLGYSFGSGSYIFVENSRLGTCSVMYYYYTTRFLHYVTPPQVLGVKTLIKCVFIGQLYELLAWDSDAILSCLLILKKRKKEKNSHPFFSFSFFSLRNKNTRTTINDIAFTIIHSYYKL